MCKKEKNTTDLNNEPYFSKKSYSFICFLISIVLIILGFILLFVTNKHELKEQIIPVVVDKNGAKEIENTLVYYFTNKHLLLSQLASALISFGTTFIITILFVDIHNRKENKSYYDKIVNLQRKTAESAITSTFNEIIDKDFLNVIKEEVIGCKTIRRNANWIYEIKVNEDKTLTLIRNISYTLYNLSTTESSNEELKITFLENDYSKTKVKSVKRKFPDDKDYKDADKKDETETTDKGYKAEVRVVEVPPQGQVDIASVVEQNYSTTFIFDTHFTNYPVVNLKLHVTYPEGYQIKINYDSLSINPKRIPSNENTEILEFNGAILKGQGLEFFCSKKK